MSEEDEFLVDDFQTILDEVLDELCPYVEEIQIKVDDEISLGGN